LFIVNSATLAEGALMADSPHVANRGNLNRALPGGRIEVRSVFRTWRSTCSGRQGGNVMVVATTKAQLTTSRKRLVEVMQALNFGIVHGLVVCDAEPVLEPLPHCVREFRFPGENGARAELGSEDFLLKTQVVQLFELFDEVRDGTFERVEVRHGLPFKALIANGTA
jgi:hypothetical protein